MATYKLIPSSWAGDATISNPSNAYSDTDSTTYVIISYFQDAYLGGFITLPLVENVTSVVVKLKAQVRRSESNYKLQATLMSAPDGIVLSDTVDITTNSATTYTFTLTASAETVASYVDTLCIHLYNVYGQHVVYGADVTIEADLKIFNNKIIYGNNTLIDLTGDTVTEADVVSGKTVHLPSGIQATGSYSPSVLKSTATTTGSTNKTVSLTVTKEPSWFLLVCAKATSSRTYRILYYMYDGENVHFGRSTTSSAGWGVVQKVTSASVTFAYSNNTLTFTAPSSATNRYFGAADWELYYL